MQNQKNIFTTLSLLMILCAGCMQKKSTLFTEGQRRGRVPAILEEASGLVSSSVNPKHLWTLNDSGNTAAIFLLNNRAEVVMVCRLAGVKNRDWEDIAIGPGPVKGEAYLYVGDIGDNEAKYDFKYVYRLAEPLLTNESSIVVSDFEHLTIQLPDGKRDMEAMTVSHQSGTIYFISKREEYVKVYQLPNNVPSTGVLVPQVVATLPYTHTVAADFSFDGLEFLLKTYDEILYWKKLPNDKFENMIARPPVKLAYNPEPQGEAIAWASDGSGFYTLSESKSDERAFLYFYKRN